ncbi:uncharacterized protein BJ212DRAFT_1446951 [Suillus subaureus]|uniref:ubiquitinyl hydrolase 1 n=1 Tax=Suillus subaureus TaxID=48587 RepID=A0A9P7JDM6_9AGAM|nr:uncharacterized protein BJ212DRAFT_1446951 [Suillus subaureus]KAG1816432.1 hypothetical protein BJ212DRAFT_1446951 [Suillus subaureus]
MVHFAWRCNIGKKAKIMCKVKFVSEFDALEVVTNELKSKLTLVFSRLKSIEKEHAEQWKVRKWMKVVQEALSSSKPAEENTDVEMALSEVPGDLEEESMYHVWELQELEALADANLKSDYGCSMTGLYDLVAIIMHKGADADAGHYISFMKKSVFHAKLGDGLTFDKDDGKVLVFPREKLGMIDGGGEDASAYVLLYRSKPLA